jgi:hypothetical protein
MLPLSDPQLAVLAAFLAITATYLYYPTFQKLRFWRNDDNLGASTALAGVGSGKDFVEAMQKTVCPPFSSGNTNSHLTGKEACIFLWVTNGYCVSFKVMGSKA